MEAAVVDYVIIAAYLVGVAIFGIVSGGKQKSIQDYFTGSQKIPWWAVCFSIVAAETSALTFISIPGLAYLTNLNFIQVTIGYLLGRIVVATVLLPEYNKGNLKTAYTFLETRFGGKTRSFASVVFIFTRTAADGVRLFATAIPIYLMLNIDPMIAIVIVAVVSLVYTYTGGIKGIIWVDVIQMSIYIGGAIIAGIFIINLLPDSLSSTLSRTSISEKLRLINWGFDNGFAGFFAQPYTLIGGLIGGAFLSMASHGTDQLVVQRLLAIKDLRGSQKAIIGSGVIVIMQFAVFLLLGVLLYAFYGPMDLRSDEIFPKFIIEVLPIGLTGIIIAALLAAAMSTLAGSMSSLSSSLMMDLYLPLTKRDLNDQQKLRISRLFTIMFGFLLVLSAFFFKESSQAVVEIALSIASFTYGGLLGTFLLGILFKKSKQEDALAGFVTGIFIMITVISLKLVAWTWFTFVGVIATLVIGGLLSKYNEREF
ncbi:MAG: sodium:solute symporter [Ignavibacterium sp.]|nr:sodium:solute symporter [Ignavibacterium sp.]